MNCFDWFVWLMLATSESETPRGQCPRDGNYYFLQHFAKSSLMVVCTSEQSTVNYDACIFCKPLQIDFLDSIWIGKWCATLCWPQSFGAEEASIAKSVVFLLNRQSFYFSLAIYFMIFVLRMQDMRTKRVFEKYQTITYTLHFTHN